MTTLRQILNTISLHVEDGERWRAAAANLRNEVALGTIDAEQAQPGIVVLDRMVAVCEKRARDALVMLGIS